MLVTSHIIQSEITIHPMPSCLLRPINETDRFKLTNLVPRVFSTFQKWLVSVQQARGLSRANLNKERLKRKRKGKNPALNRLFILANENAF